MTLGGVEEISPHAVQARLAAGDADFFLLDCRDPEEFAYTRIVGAVNIPMGDIANRLPHLDPEKEIVVHCHHGVRSYKVALWLKQQGFERVRSMAGGIDAWSREVDPTVTRY